VPAVRLPCEIPSVGDPRADSYQVRRSRFSWLFSWHAIAALGLVAVCAAVSGAHVLQQQVEARVIRGATDSARIIVSLVVARNITYRDIGTVSVPPVEQEDMDGDVAVLRDKNQLADLRVWSLAHGGLIYTDSTAGPRVQVLSADAVDRAGEGSFVRSTPRLVDVFIPYDPDGGSNYTAVVEVRLPRDPINQTVQLWTTVVYAGSAGAVVLTFLIAVVFRRRHRRNEYQVRHDALTGLGNRTLLAEATARLLGRDRHAAMLLLDLDGFKEVNDTLGHDAGDQLLSVVADRLRSAGALQDVLIRLGGDEFVVLLPGVATAEQAVAAAERLRIVLRQPIVIGDVPVEVDASVGVALAPEHGDDLTTLLKRADVAMYEAKRGGTGVAVYDLATDSREAQHLSVLAELREAITAGQLRLYYQPKSHTDGRIDEVEALVRWQHPTRGLLPPAEFVPLAERTSLIKPLTAWVVQEAARQGGRWRAEGRELSIAVNVSARNLADDELIETVTGAAAAAGIPVQTLQLEITETAVMTDPVAVGRTLGEFFQLGVHVSIDDFGVGYTSLSHLSTLPVRALKIDRRFVTDLLTNPVDEVLVRNVIQLARDLGLISIAEGVESPEVWQRLVELGCDEIQGYVLTAPLPPADFDAWLDDWRLVHDQQAVATP
jgi:diguanylate cyclase (GGDEF)-like protein